MLRWMAIVGLLAYAIWGGRLSGCEAIEERAQLHLVRWTVETFRAQFCYRTDCELAAKYLNEAEPNVLWRCR